MKKWFARTVIRLSGWKIVNKIGKFPKSCVIFTAPHTSWWDAVLAIACVFLYDLHPRTLVKKELFKFPFKQLLVMLGAIPVDRYDPKAHKDRQEVLSAVITELQSEKGAHVGISPEGTRKKNDRWKSGFYRLAQAADVPLALAIIDNVNKIGILSELYHLTGDYDADMRYIMAVYANVPIKDDSKFALDHRYLPSSTSS